MELFLPLLWICAVSHISFNHSPSTTSKPHILSEGDRSLIFCHSTQEQTTEQTQIRCTNVFFLLATGLLEKCSILKLVRDFSPGTGCGSEAWAKDIYGERSFLLECSLCQLAQCWGHHSSLDPDRLADRGLWCCSVQRRGCLTLNAFCPNLNLKVT